MADIEHPLVVSVVGERATITFSSSLSSQTQFETLITAPPLSEEDTENRGKNIRVEKGRT